MGLAKSRLMTHDSMQLGHVILAIPWPFRDTHSIDQWEVD